MLVTASMVTVTMGAQPASAADAAPARGLEEMVVTAQKREEKLIDIPQSIQAFDGSFVEDRNIRDMRDVFSYVPGASVSFSGGSGSQLYNLRGTGGQGRIGQLAIGFYIDEVPWIAGGPFGPPIQLFDLSSMEVLRGPQGTLYGQGSMGGTFVITTQRPNMKDVEARGQVYGMAQNQAGNTWGVDGTMSVPLIDDELGMRITGGYRHEGGMAESDDFPGTNIDNYRDYNVRVKLRWEPTDDFSAQLTVWHLDEDRNFSPGIYGSVDPPLILGTGGTNSAVTQKTNLTSLVLDYDLGFATVTSSTSYVKSEGLFDAAFAFLTTTGPNSPPISNVLQLTVPANSKSVDEEIRLTSNGDGPLKWIVGAELTEVKGDNTIISAFIVGPLVGLVPDALSANRSRSQRWAGFGEVSYDLFDGALVPLVGIRYYSDSQEVFSASSTSGVYDVHAQFDAWSPRFNLSWKPSDDMTFYVNIAKGFRSGVTNTPTQVTLARGLGIGLTNELKESTLWSYEVGARLNLFDNTLRVEPAVYHIVYDDYQFEGSAGNVNFALPIKELSGTGVDLLVVWAPPIDGLMFNLTASYSPLEPQDIDPAISARTRWLAKDEQLPFVPKYSYKVEGIYEWPLGWNDFTAFGGLAYTHRDKQVDFITGLESDDPMDISMRLGVRKDRYSITLNAENLTDEEGPSVIAGGLPNRYDRQRFTVTFAGTLR